VIEARSIVEVEAPSRDGVSSIPWEEASELIASQPDDESLAALEYVYDSPFVAGAAELAEFARPTFTPRRPLAEALSELSHRIYTEFKYKPNSTSIKMPLLEVLRNRQGVCQDFAHIMIGALRSLRLPARYTSGYLRSSPGSHGAEASHAWVSAFVPGSGWMSYDPTNDVMPSDGHLTLAWGRDYGDVTPVKGVAVGGGSHSVEVEVEVKPIESD
jgi:transglutaminase-like putative cysteine protease